MVQNNMLSMKEVMSRPVTHVIANIKPFDKNIEIKAIVLEHRGEYNLKNAKMTQYLIADNSGSIFLNVYGAEYNSIKPGDILLVSSAYATLYKDNMILYTSKGGHLFKIGSFFMVYKPTPNVSLIDWMKEGYTLPQKANEVA